MTTPLLIADLERDEGLRLEAYPDPESGGAPWTIEETRFSQQSQLVGQALRFVAFLFCARLSHV